MGASSVTGSGSGAAYEQKGPGNKRNQYQPLSLNTVAAGSFIGSGGGNYGTRNYIILISGMDAPASHYSVVISSVMGSLGYASGSWLVRKDDVNGIFSSFVIACMSGINGVDNPGPVDWIIVKKSPNTVFSVIPYWPQLRPGMTSSEVIAALDQPDKITQRESGWHTVMNWGVYWGIFQRTYWQYKVDLPGLSYVPIIFDHEGKTLNSIHLDDRSGIDLDQLLQVNNTWTIDDALQQLGPPDFLATHHIYDRIEKDLWVYHVKGTDINLQLQFWNGQVFALFNDFPRVPMFWYVPETVSQPLRTYAEIQLALGNVTLLQVEDITSLQVAPHSMAGTFYVSTGTISLSGETITASH